MRTWLIAGLAGLLVVVGWAAPASATAPSVPTVRLAGVTSTSFTVHATATNGTYFVVYYSTTKTALNVANILAHPPRSVTAHGSSITVGTLAYTTAPYYYRVRAYNGAPSAKTAYKWGVDILEVGLAPPAPSGLSVAVHPQTSLGTYLYWRPQSTNAGFVVTQATNAAMTTGLVTRSITGPDYQYTPAGLTRGTTYYFKVRARNLTTLSPYSAEVSFTAASSQTSIRVMTYNVLGAAADGTQENGQTIAAWQGGRDKAAAALIEKVLPDVAGIQEASAFIGEPQGLGGTRQIDDLVALLAPSGYALARTEVPPTEHGYMRFGNYVIYRKAVLTPVGDGGHWDIGDGRSAAYQEFRVNSTGATFIDVSPHTLPNSGGTTDAQRQAETTTMLKLASALSAADQARVVFNGDFNSDAVAALHKFDGPAIVMRSSTYRYNDAHEVATSLTNAQYNSFNGYLRSPPLSGADIDHIYVGPGVAVTSWGLAITLSGGKFVGTIPSDHNPVYATVQLPF